MEVRLLCLCVLCLCDELIIGSEL